MTYQLEHSLSTSLLISSQLASSLLLQLAITVSTCFTTSCHTVAFYKLCHFFCFSFLSLSMLSKEKQIRNSFSHICTAIAAFFCCFFLRILLITVSLARTFPVSKSALGLSAVCGHMFMHKNYVCRTDDDVDCQHHFLSKRVTI